MKLWTLAKNVVIAIVCIAFVLACLWLAFHANFPEGFAR